MDKKNLDSLCQIYAKSHELTTYHYRVLFLLMKNEMNQAQMTIELETTKQNINKVCKELLQMDLIYISCIEGRNKYYKINEKPCVQLKGQISIDDFITSH